MKTMRMCTLVAAVALVLAACSGKSDDAASSAAASPDAGAPVSQPEQAMPASAPSAGAGEMQALLTRLVAPARSATDAATQFVWVGGNDPKPAAALGRSVDALSQAIASEKARIQAAGAQVRQVSLPPDMAAMANDPNAQEAMQKKMDGMSQQEKIAWAMQMASRQATHMQAQMQQQAQQVTAEDEAAEQKFAEHLQQISMKRVQGAMPSAQIVAEKNGLDRQSQTAHEAIDRDLELAIRQIPYEQEGEGGGGCYNTANARRVYDFKVKAADRHVAQADKDLAQAGQWATKYRAALQLEARDDDALHAELAAIRHSVMEGRNALQASGVRDATLNHFGSYLKGVQDSDLAATRWVRAREEKRKEDWSLWDCGTNHG